MSESKLTWKTALIGAAGLGLMSYAALRKPRWVMDGAVGQCEGAAGNDCQWVSYGSAGASGEVYSPARGTVVKVEYQSSATVKVRIASESEPIQFTFILKNGSTPLREGQLVKQGDIVGRAQQMQLLVERFNPGAKTLEVVSPSAWLAVNGFTHVKNPGGNWCESQKALAVPNCGNENFAAPRLPRWSLKNIQVSMG